ncbi:MAG: hypothetical protein A2747_02990 [Candidatus Yonathbacteria bacterium RIFCSPHIGHO2_01_FULL_44_41]|uniref:General secretion pathway GspH domain-containing protein n=1 Tax=Candidatus Yonathbacteria bacterium RIFCSPHIGHO2_02_FULL_44_14 TaxID=1802724 RepID=A0A1G2S732_9BACT|nr:MAG: hypothetical protein A2747_02990 [Candidatus Yonathbacteria bacterium RIFCSPHIGHO2_01_FULL_44_41]OHA80528.1 MAG: hypothetical protein A3D51_00400 [Candidatus Yonathbacteria bacterium RIFCSPHIGHO2_02_FULL_44_14]OHA82180.1 MAG: hypothetical protein A3B06_01595 [Candidatus Yonathbacteria bacterium RIFCSPLOWO2_01_FULL_43_20]
MSILQTKKGFTRQNFSKKNLGGFTLVEMTVSIGLFTIVLFIATSAFLSIVNADRKSRAVRIATDNLNLALEDMSRRIKTGLDYHCGAVDTATPADCQNGDGTLYFTGQDGLRIKYTSSGGAILRRIAPEVADTLTTAPEINITNLKFFVNGSLPYGTGAGNDKLQPVVTIVVDGELASGSSSQTKFKIQTTVAQRLYDH